MLHACKLLDPIRNGKTYGSTLNLAEKIECGDVRVTLDRFTDFPWAFMCV